MGSLRDRGKRLKGKPPTSKPAAQPPLVEERAAPPPGHKPLVVRPPERKRSVTVKPVPAPPPEEHKPAELSPAEERPVVPAPPPAMGLSAPPTLTSRDEATVPAKRVPIPKVLAAPQGPSTEQLSVSDMELVESETATSRDPVDPVHTPATPAAPNMEKPPERTARFNAPGEVFNLRIAGLKLRLEEIMDPTTIKVVILGGKENHPTVLGKGVQVTLSCETADGKDVNVLLTYNGLSKDGSALEVHCVVEGAVTTLAQTISRAASTARGIVSGAPSSWRFLSSVVAMSAGIATIFASFTMPAMKALSSLGQYGIAAAGILAAGLGFWSIIERMRYNDNTR